MSVRNEGLSVIVAFKIYFLVQTGILKKAQKKKKIFESTTHFGCQFVSIP